MSAASPGSAFSVSNRSGSYSEWKRSIPPTETEPIVSPWYAIRSATKRRRSCPRWRQYWNAILSAISVAVEPESE
jgi:hypothetical protein